MKRSIIILPVVMAVNILIFSCSPSVSKKENRSSKVDSVAVFTLKKVAVNKKLTFPAELTPIERAEMYAKISGYVKEIKVDIGDRVKKGEVLITLEAPEVLSSMLQANSEMQTARSKYLTSIDTYRRILNASKVEGTIAKAELEITKNQMLADSSLVEASKSKLSFSAQFKEYLTITSPFNGIVTQRNADLGTLTGSSNSKPLLIVEDASILRLRLPIPESYSASIPDTSVVEFTVEATPGKVYSATLSRKSGTINLSNRTETWEYTYRNTENVLKSGMFANASLKLGREELSFLVPSSAIVTNLEKRFVIRLTEGKAEWIDVKNGFSQNDKVEIFGVLQEGDQLLMSATDEIKPGTKLVGKVKKY